MQKLQIKTGVYRIRNLVNNKVYIGSSAIDFSNRWRLHIRQLNECRHHSIVLQRAWNKYKKGSFVFEVLLYCDPENCLMYEQAALDSYQPAYNISPTAGSSLGIQRSQEFKNKVATSHIGLKHSKDTKQKISEAHKGQKNHRWGKPGTRLGKRSHTKLTEEDVLYIRQAIVNGVKIKDLAIQFKVHRSTISRVKHHVTW